jgi:rhodanese-related sulfurtransferase
VSDTERLFARFGTRVLVIAKFIPGLGAVTTAMSGVVKAGLPGFLLYAGMGAALWVGSGVTLGSIFHDAVGDVFDELATLGRAGGLLILVLLIAFLALKFWRRRQFLQQLRMSRITVQELNRLRQGGVPVLLVDARSSASRARDGMIPGAIPFEALLHDVEQSRRGGEAVVYCACPNEATAAQIARKLISMGFHPVRPLIGGIHAWQDAGFALTPPSATHLASE